jgi:hypothetical protein
MNGIAWKRDHGMGLSTDIPDGVMNSNNEIDVSSHLFYLSHSSSSSMDLLLLVLRYHHRLSLEKQLSWNKTSLSYEAFGDL